MVVAAALSGQEVLWSGCTPVALTVLKAVRITRCELTAACNDVEVSEF